MIPYYRYCNECGKKIDVTTKIHFDDGQKIECFPRHSLQRDHEFMREFTKIGNK